MSFLILPTIGSPVLYVNEILIKYDDSIPVNAAGVGKPRLSGGSDFSHRPNFPGKYRGNVSPDRLNNAFPCTLHPFGQPRGDCPYALRITHHPLPITCHASPITHHPSHITHYSLLITHYSLRITLPFFPLTHLSFFSMLRPMKKACFGV